jgi:AcrR family transcriptional regulator
MIDKTTRTPSEKIGPEVLNAAVEILNDQGPDGFTVRAIALRAKVAPMAIYNHFEGVNGVLEALWTEGFEALSDALTFSSGDAYSDLFNAALGYRAFALEHRGLYTVMFMHRFRNFQPSLQGVHVAAQSFETIVVNVERCQASGLFQHMQARDAAQVVWSACHGYVSLELLDINFAENRDETFQLLLETLRDGFR